MSIGKQYSLRLNDEETAAVERRAREEGLYPHGLIRSCVRLCLGLPVARRTADVLAPPERDRTT